MTRSLRVLLAICLLLPLYGCGKRVQRDFWICRRRLPNEYYASDNDSPRDLNYEIHLLNSFRIGKQAAAKLGVDLSEVHDVMGSFSFVASVPEDSDDCESLHVTFSVKGGGGQHVEAVVDAVLQSLAEYENTPERQPPVRRKDGPLSDGSFDEWSISPPVPYEIATGDRTKLVRYIKY